MLNNQEGITAFVTKPLSYHQLIYLGFGLACREKELLTLINEIG